MAVKMKRPIDLLELQLLRSGMLFWLFALVALLLLARAVQLQLLRHNHLSEAADARHIGELPVPAHRGSIQDRHGEALAISTPAQSVWVDPARLSLDAEQIAQLAGALELNAADLLQRLTDQRARRFLYISRRVQPERAAAVSALALEGVQLQTEYRRYYPLGESSGHLLGFTDVDDRGQEGLERAFDSWLSGRDGIKRVVRDPRGRVLRELDYRVLPRPGRVLRLTLDRRLQYLLYRELKAAVLTQRARGGSALIVDSQSGDILALASQPSFNPNERSSIRDGRFRNRALSDRFEPGSTMKPFIVAAALESGAITAQTQLPTAGGELTLFGHRIRDLRDFGDLDPAGVIRHSSNVGAALIAQSIRAQTLFELLSGLGFGSGERAAEVQRLPGEVSGLLRPPSQWYGLDQPTLGFGYGLNTTTLQLARAYTILAADGLRGPLRLQHSDSDANPAGERDAATRILSADTARRVRQMMEAVVSSEGTGRRAQLPGYRVAGKTGTVHKPAEGGYAKDRYMSLFAGLVPADRPRLVMVVVIDEPSAGQHFGGQVAAPVFRAVMRDALRLLSVAPERVAESGEDGPAQREEPEGSG